MEARDKYSTDQYRWIVLCVRRTAPRLWLCLTYRRPIADDCLSGFERSRLEGIAPMKILILGSGGREHALAWATSRSPRVTEVVCAPGNGGIAEVARCVPVDLKDVDAMVRLAEAERPDLTIVGPELPLSLGVVDAFRERNYRIFGPTREAAKLESSKAFAKQFMKRYQIPTARYAVCTSAKEVEESLKHFHPPIVVKADGLAAGKGVIICPTLHFALETAQGLFNGELLGSVERQVVIEEFLEGEELSFLCLTDGKHVAPLVPAQDHKRIGEGDTGPNTGGMGVYSTSQMLEPTMTEWILHHIAEPTVRGMAEENTAFTGVLYCGLMMTAKGPQVLEYNARFGDPETQAILVRLESDLVDALEACIEGRLAETELRWTPGASASVVASSAGYPGSYKTGLQVSGVGNVAQVPGVEVFHSGTARTDTQLVTSGGRVLAVTAAGDTLQEALGRAYQAMAQIHFEGMYYRRDIGHRALNKAK